MKQTFKETFITEVSVTEIDLLPPFYNANNPDIRNDVELAIPYYDIEVPSLDIDSVISTMEFLKTLGADRVYISPHIDHQGYYFYGVKLTEVLP